MDKFEAVRRACEIANAHLYSQKEKLQPLPKFDWDELDQEMRNEIKLQPVKATCDEQVTEKRVLACLDPVDYEIEHHPPHQSFFSKHNRLGRQVRDRPYTFGRKRCYLIMVNRMS